MNIVIIGGGGVGYELARNFSGKNQDVTIIENDPERAAMLSDRLDVMTVTGDGANVAILEKAGIKKAQIVIAVTQVDEVNIIACMVAKRLGVSFTVARVRDVEYLERSHALIQEQMGIDFIINPERAAALEMSKMIHFPDASEIEYFAQGKVMMVGVTVDERAGITNQSLLDLPLPTGCIIVGIKRPQGKFIVPDGSDIIKPGDKIYLQGKSDVLRDVSGLLHHEHLEVQKVTILGGGMTGYQLASILEDKTKGRPFTVKLVEKDPARCDELSSCLSRTLVLQGDATDLSFFREEEIEDADVLVAATRDDRTNLLAGVLGKQLGVKKVISIVSNLDYLSIFSTLGIESVVNPHVITAAQILRFTRTENVVALSVLKDENAEVMELILQENAKVVGKKVSKANFPRGMIIGAIVRDEEVIVPHGNTVLMANDRLIVFALPHISRNLDSFFAGNQKKQNHKNRFSGAR